MSACRLKRSMGTFREPLTAEAGSSRASIAAGTLHKRKTPLLPSGALQTRQVLHSGRASSDCR